MSRKNKTKNATPTEASDLGMFANKNKPEIAYTDQIQRLEKALAIFQNENRANNDPRYEACNSVLKKNGLRDMLERFEHKEYKNEKITHKNMISLFEKCQDFKLLKKPSGHIEFKHKITGAIIGFSGHKGDGTLNINEKKGHAETIRVHIKKLAQNISPLISESKSPKPSC
jgi:hypothetical protein